MPNLGPGELIVILLIVVVLFGGGRIARLGGELGTAMREFRRGLNAGETETNPKPENQPKETADEAPKPS